MVYSLRFDTVEINLLVGRVPSFLASSLRVRGIGLIASLFVLFGQSRASIILKKWEVNAVTKRKDSNCVGIISDQGEAATASNLSEYTIP